MNAPSAIILLMLFVSLFKPISFLTSLIFILPVFGSLALFPPEWVGDSSFTPGTFAAFLLIIKSLFSQNILKRIFSSIVSFNQFGLLGLFLVISILGALLLPQIFQGEIQVYGMRTPWIGLVEPSTANFTQSAYLILSTLAAVVFSILIKRQNFIQTILNAILFGAYAVIATGLLDMATNYTGTSDLLSMFYTAKYGYSSGEILGAHRVLGLTPEPAAYGSMAASYCALLLFFRPVFPLQKWRHMVPITALGCGIMALLSRSSTAYAMIFTVLLVYIFYSIHRVLPSGTVEKKTLTQKMFWMAGILSAVIIISLLDSSILQYFVDLIDNLIFQKHNTSSYIERSDWTAVGLKAFFESYGLGVGVGSVRTSNFFVNILASTGILGMTTFCSFLYMVFTRKASKLETRDNVIIGGAKLSLIPIFTGMTLAGTTPDFGILPGILFGIIIGLAQLVKNNSAEILATQHTQ